MYLVNALGRKVSSTLEVVKVQKLHVGDRVKLIGVPDWLIQDLPEDEKQEIIAFIGRVGLIEEIDRAGYYWLGFGSVIEEADTAYYSGHSFCVPSEYLEVA